MAIYSGGRYYNDPAIGAVAQNLASLFGPPSAQDQAARARAALDQQALSQREALWTSPNDPMFDRRGVVAGLYAPSQSYYAVDTADATARRGQDVSAAASRYGTDVQAATSRANNAADNQRAAIASLFGPLNPGQERPAVPADVAGLIGVPGLSAAAGPAAMPTLAQAQGAQFNTLPDADRTRLLFGGDAPVRAVGPDGKPRFMDPGQAVMTGAEAFVDPHNSVTVNTDGGTAKDIYKSVEDSAGNARMAAKGVNSIGEAKAALEAGIISGSGADARLALQKIAALMGGDASQVVNTETFRAAIAPQVGAMLRATTGSTQVSDADRAFAQNAVGGNIALDSGSISKLLDIMQRANASVLQQHQTMIDQVYPDMPDGRFRRERAILSVPLPGGLGQVPSAPPSVDMPRPTTPEEMRALPSGTRFIAPDGQIRMVP